MKKRILSLVLCAAMLLSMCLFLGAGVAEDTTADGSAESTESYIPAVNFTNVAPFVQANAQAANGPARAPLRAGANAAATQAADNGVVTSKTATANSDGTYTITLEAYATGSKVITEVKEDIPTDIVLVLDQSSSMADCIVCGGEMDGDNDQHLTGYQKVSKSDISRYRTYYVIVDGSYQKVTWHDGVWGFGRGWYDDNDVKRDPNSYAFYQATGYEACTSRLSALKTALNNFTAAVRTKALGTDGQAGTEDDVDHRIAMVGFASDNTKNLDNKYENTELLTTSTVVNYSSAQSTDYKNALVSVLDEKGNLNSRISNAVKGLAASGGTAIDLGTKMANNVLEQHKNETGRNKVVIIFTDGVPGIYQDDSNETRDGYANRAIANTLKAKRSATEASAPGYGATVYTVGVFDGADASTPGQLSNATGWGDNGRANRFMHLLSSNYPVAENMNVTGAVKSDLNGKSYYLSASDSTALNNIFQQISNNIETGGSSSTLTAEAVVKDVISPQFQLPKGATAKDIQLETYACTGKTGDTYTWTKNNDTMGARATVENDTVSVTGFDFAENYVGTVTNNDDVTYRGNKLRISFEVVPKNGFLGGNDVFTNDNAAIYDKSTATEPVRTFDDKPQVNVPIKKVSVTAADKNVYLLGDLTAAELKNGATVKVGDVSLDLSQENYGLAAWQTDYVDIGVTITDKDGNVVTTDGLSSLKDDTTYTVTVKVSPKETATDTTTSGAEATVQTGRSNEANVNVYKPELTYKDSEVYYGEAVPSSFEENRTLTEWKHGDTVADTTTMGPAPTLTMIYTPEAAKIDGGKINTRQDVGVDVTVKIDETDVTDKASFVHTNCEETTCKVPDGCEFVLHVKTCSLTISKAVTGDNGWDPHQTFVFKVTNNTTKETMEVVITGTGSKKITGLPVGSYTVTEDTNWSWSFKTDNGNQTVTLSSASDNRTVDVVNTFTQKNWLTSFAEVINKWIDGKIDPIKVKN